jgi:hypothetical protein
MGMVQMKEHSLRAVVTGATSFDPALLKGRAIATSLFSSAINLLSASNAEAPAALADDLAIPPLSCLYFRITT